MLLNVVVTVDVCSTHLPRARIPRKRECCTTVLPVRILPHALNIVRGSCTLLHQYAKACIDVEQISGISTDINKKSLRPFKGGVTTSAIMFSEDS